MKKVNALAIIIAQKPHVRTTMKKALSYLKKIPTATWAGFIVAMLSVHIIDAVFGGSLFGAVSILKTVLAITMGIGVLWAHTFFKTKGEKEKDSELPGKLN